ncbi:hypothetical protein Y1Q_0010608 [Alligator mississippiensis]|uniref:Ig-like domain-containing protein n=1 Tax=Alligator mississippiensis TaxID=8496 RepID=A0A151PGS8_ALLMI|nr:hypothetical protein Y1Q_0010608 [Alligator mississippiensis]
MRLLLPVLCLLCAVSSCGAQVSQSPEVLVTREGDRSAMVFTCCRAQVSQSPAALVTREGDRSTMACTYSNTYRPFQWYRQVPSGEITHLLTVAASRNATEGRFTGESREDGKKCFLNLSQARLGDSGRYFCAVDAQ